MFRDELGKVITPDFMERFGQFDAYFLTLRPIDQAIGPHGGRNAVVRGSLDPSIIDANNIAPRHECRLPKFAGN